MSSKPSALNQPQSQSQQMVNMPRNHHRMTFNPAQYQQALQSLQRGPSNALNGLSQQPPPPYHTVVHQPHHNHLVVSIHPLVDDTGGLPTYEEATRESSPPSFDVACSMGPLSYRVQSSPFFRY